MALHAEDTSKEAAPIPYNTSITIDGDASDWPQDSGMVVRAFAEDGVPTVQTGDFTPTAPGLNDDGSGTGELSQHPAYTNRSARS